MFMCRCYLILKYSKKNNSSKQDIKMTYEIQRTLVANRSAILPELQRQCLVHILEASSFQEVLFVSFVGNEP